MKMMTQCLDVVRGAALINFSKVTLLFVIKYNNKV